MAGGIKQGPFTGAVNTGRDPQVIFRGCPQRMEQKSRPFAKDFQVFTMPVLVSYLPPHHKGYVLTRLTQGKVISLEGLYYTNTCTICQPLTNNANTSDS